MSKKKEEYDSFTEAVLNSALIGIVGYAALLASTALASGLFGLPKYLVTPWQWEKGRGPVLRFVVAITIKFVFFFLSAIAGTLFYFALQIRYLVHFATNGATEWPNYSENDKFPLSEWWGEKEEWSFDSAKNFLSMVVFTCWFMLFYRSIVQYNTVEKIIEEDPSLDDSNPKDITKE